MRAARAQPTAPEAGALPIRIASFQLSSCCSDFKFIPNSVHRRDAEAQRRGSAAAPAAVGAPRAEQTQAKTH